MDKNILQDGDIILEQNEYIFNPYNENNTEITESDVNTIFKKHGIKYTVKNIKLFVRAFCHKSYVKRPFLKNKENNVTIVDKPHNAISLKQKSNERLEFLGDGILEAIIKFYLYKRFPNENEGFMTEKKIALVKNESIGKIAYDMGINKWYVISKHAEEKKTRTNLKKLGCLFEAFLGALFLDANKLQLTDKIFNNFVLGPGFQVAQTFVEIVIEKYVNWNDLINKDENYKNILQVKIQKEFKTTPYYHEIEKSDENVYHMGVYLCINTTFSKDLLTNENKKINFTDLKNRQTNGEKLVIFLASSKHKIKKKAEQHACMIALENIVL